MTKKITFGNHRHTIDDIANIANQTATAALNEDSAYRAHITKGPTFLKELLDKNGVIYGVTTGYGDSCTTQVPVNLAYELPHHLTRYHGCGLGAYFDDATTRAILATRLSTLSQGFSGVRVDLLEQLVALINHNILPQIPEEGSVGASGDLTPLSYVAACLIGERTAKYNGTVQPVSDIFTTLNLTPLTLMPKEGLAIMNGTAVMTAIACLAYKRCETLVKWATRITSLMSIALKGNAAHFAPELFRVKAHPGIQSVAASIWNDLNTTTSPEMQRLQDRYAIRCAPHVIGVLVDAMTSMKDIIEIELNSANDNPIIDPDNHAIWHGGHFYGGHIAHVADTMKTNVANIADLLDRQLALLVDSKFNHGLPANLCGATGERMAINHGFKAVQISVSAWTAEALKHTMPASVFSRSTECHNQDKVSMGTIAARDAVRVLDLTEQVLAACLLAVTQAIQLRINANELDLSTLSPTIQTDHNARITRYGFVTEDRPLETTLRQLCHDIRHGTL